MTDSNAVSPEGPAGGTRVHAERSRTLLVATAEGLAGGGIILLVSWGTGAGISIWFIILAVLAFTVASSVRTAGRLLGYELEARAEDRMSQT
jgi:hypothetical protein